MVLIILLVIYVVIMLLWGLSLWPGTPTYEPYRGPLAFLAVLVLGTVVFVVGAGWGTLPK